MVRRIGSPAGLAIAVCAISALVAPASVALGQPAQPGQPAVAAPDQRNAATATLPESNEALLITGRVEQAIRDGEFQLAAELIATIAKIPGELVASPASRTYYPAWRQALRLLLQFPPQGVAVYRQLYDAEVRSRLDEARKANDISAMQELFRTYPLSSVWLDVSHELATRLAESGEFAEAIRVLRETQSADLEDRPELRGLLAATLALAGAQRSALAIATELADDARLSARPGWTQRIKTLREWIEQRGDPARVAARALRPRLLGSAFWTQPLLTGALGEAGEDDEEIAALVDSMRRLPLLEPVIADDRLIVRARGSIWALDSTTLSPLWQVDELRLDDAPAPAGFHVEHDELGLPHGGEQLLLHHLRHTLSAGGGTVFTIESVTLGETEPLMWNRRGAFTPDMDMTRRNELVARSLADGRIIWRTGEDTSNALFDVAFQDAPLVLGDRVVAPFRREGEVRLAVLNAKTGKAIREVPVAGAPTYFSNAGGRCLLALDETTIYVSTGNGVVAALDREDFGWQWAAVYQSTLAQHLGQFGWVQNDPPAESGVDRPVIAGELLILAPMDSTEIMAFDRFSGREVWRIPRREFSFVVGATSDGLIVGGNGLACLNIENPERSPVRWRTVSLEIVGRPVLIGDRLYAPTRDGVIALDARSGKMMDGASPKLDAQVAELARREPRRDGADAAEVDTARGGAANLIAGPDALYRVSANQVTKFADPAAARRQAELLADKDASDPRATLTLAWLDLLDGKLGEAAARLETLKSDDDTITRARDRLLTQVFIDLARDAAAGEDKLTRLRQAAALAHAPEIAARLATIIGAALEQEQRWDEALDHYGASLTGGESRMIEADGDPRLRVAEWVHAVDRIRFVLDRVPSARRDAWLAGQVERLSGQPGGALALCRLASALDRQSAERVVGVALAVRRVAKRDLPIELAALFLPESDPSDLSADKLRALLLARWEAHTALGRIADAEQDERRWGEAFGGKPLEDDDALARESMRVDSIRSAMAKAAEFRGVPFGGDYFQMGRRWRVKQAELVIDRQRPTLSSDGWIVANSYSDQKLQLRETLRNQQPQRERVFGIGAGIAARPAEANTQRLMQQMALRGVDRPRRETWAMATYEQLAAVPAPGGLLCVGLGPALYGGGTIWEQPLPLWDEPPRDFDVTSVATPMGVVVKVRRDRLALLSWFDGRVCWQREFPGVSISEVHRCGQSLVVIGEDSHVWSLDAARGDHVARLPSEFGSPVAVDVAGPTLVIWSDSEVAGLDPVTMKRVWRRPVRSVELRRVVYGADATATTNWIVFRQRDRVSWDVIDAIDGTLKVESITDIAGELTAAAFADRKLWLASRVGDDSDSGAGAMVHLTCIDPQSRDKSWSRPIRSGVSVNLSQLVGHPEFIAILGDAAAKPDSPALTLVSKRDGSLGQPFSIKREFDTFPDFQCDPFVLVTPTRIIVQITGNLLAFGAPPVSGQP